MPKPTKPKMPLLAKLENLFPFGSAEIPRLRRPAANQFFWE
jgi:hypothetical protein